MTTLSNTWSPSAPADGDNIRDGDDEIRKLKLDIAERMTNGDHSFSATGTGDAQDGRHVAGKAGTTGQFRVFDSDGTTVALVLGDASAASPYTNTLTLASPKTFVGAGITSGSDPGHTHEYTLAVPIGTPAATGIVTGLYFENRGAQSMVVNGGKIVCGTGPTSSNFTVSVLRQASGYTAVASAGNAIFATNPTVANPNSVGAEATSMVATEATLAQGDAIYFNVTALNGAQNTVLYLRYRKA